MTALLAPLNARRSSRWRPPPPAMPLLSFARTMRLPDGPAEGQLWDPDSEPVQRIWIDTVASRRWNMFVDVAPSQRGKTLKAIILIWLHAITQRRQKVGYVMPSLDKLEQNWIGKIKPAIEGTGFGAWLPTSGPGSRGGKPAALVMRDPRTGIIAALTYFMAMGGGGKETSVSSVSPSVILCDEADDAQDAGQLMNVRKRIESHGANGIGVIASTVNDRVGRTDHPILINYEQGTRSRVHHRCPHCTAYFAPELEHLDIDRAAIVCPKCAAIWSEDDRHRALNACLLVHHGQVAADGRVTGPEPTADKFSLLTTGLDYHMGILSSIAADYRAAQVAESRGDPSLMRNHMHKVWCRAYVPAEPEGEINSKTLHLASGASTYSKRIVPQWARFLTMSQDVQGDRHYWIVIGHGPDERWCIIDWGYEYLAPRESGAEPSRAHTKADRMRVMSYLAQLAREGWQVEGGEERMRPVQCGIDCGYVTDEVVSWVQGNPQWKAVRGVGQDELKDTGKDSVEKTLPAEIRATKALRAVRPSGWRVYWWKVDGSYFRHAAHAALLRTPDQYGSGMIPAGLKQTDGLIQHLCGEVWMPPTVKDGKAVAGYWARHGKRWDLLDCLVYALALGLLHRYLPDRRDDGGDLPPLPPRPRGNVGNYLTGLS